MRLYTGVYKGCIQEIAGAASKVQGLYTGVYEGGIQGCIQGYIRAVYRGI